MKLVGTDIDGTILPPSGEFSERTRAALAALEPAGIPLVLVTARPPRWVDAIAASLGVTGLAVCGNGAVVYDMGERRIVDAEGVPTEHLLAIAERLRAALPGVVFAVESPSGFSREPGFPLSEHNLAPHPVAPFHELPAVQDGTVFKVLALLTDGDADDMLAAALPLCDGLLEASHSASVAPLIELAPLGITKASGLARQAERFGVAAADVVAFGDAPNDIPMLAWAGSSYAVANAHADVLAAAQHRTAAVGDDGVAQVLERLLAATS
ncbi:Cof-type HAD-IIB family hydrolase [Demequina sp. TTPB684]|uniref:HAD family hydrolase n=1 Tax=unclassified Demequina TaxID=2620311 RepID=UPI001CF20DB3|nr:HAD family hydrolase [Demequina sp. TMPB413]MCB2411345.1 Cof-type HAD-IIB family hydrolase [Demequina sp. TTPB684]UPU88032.1 Cof-type HAD-IIB family hydrolase [Demequina sp. TMPB413]